MMKIILSEIKEKGKYTTKLNDYWNKYLIYKLTVLSSGKFYIGQTSNLKKRLYYYLTSNNRENHFIKKAILKYGKQNVELEIIEVCDSRNDLNLKEIYYIKFFESYNIEKGYNLTFGGNAPILTDAVIEKKIESSKKVKVASYDLKGNLIKIYPSVKFAARSLNFNDTDIHRSCKKKLVVKGLLFSKCLSEKIEVNERKRKGKSNTTTYNVFDLKDNIIDVVEGRDELYIKYNIPKKYVDNIIKRQTIFNKQLRLGIKHE